jgi:yeast amino acid transporter
MAFWLSKDEYPPEIWITVFLVIPFLFNNFNVRRYGEIEYWLTVIKVLTIVGIIVLGVLLPMNATPNQRLLGTNSNLSLIPCPDNSAPGQCLGAPGFGCTPPVLNRLTIDWREGAFREYLLSGSAGQFLGLWACCCQAIFSYLGAELIGIAADETERQRETLPKAVRRVSYRVVIYYVGGVLALGLNISANDPILKSYVDQGGYESPFVLMVQRAGIPHLAHVINAVALVATVSVANANLYVSVYFICVFCVDCRVEVCMPLQRRTKLLQFLRGRIVGTYQFTVYFCLWYRRF